MQQAGLDARFSGFEAALASQEAVSLGNYSSLEGKLTRLTDHLLPAQGPTDSAGVRAAVADDSAIRALGKFGPEWLYSVRELIPMEVMVKVLEQNTAIPGQTCPKKHGWLNHPQQRLSPLLSLWDLAPAGGDLSAWSASPPSWSSCLEKRLLG
ncbi:TPA: hypothetical protein ACH3X2_003982 [Trebouxia sp. C0005]